MQHHKIAEHKRKYERLREEKKLKRVQKERAERQKAYEESKKHSAHKHRDSDEDMGPEDMGGMPGGMGGLGDLFSDPELVAEMADPDVRAAFEDMKNNPANLMKHQSNPKARIKLLYNDHTYYTSGTVRVNTV